MHQFAHNTASPHSPSSPPSSQLTLFLQAADMTFGLSQVPHFGKEGVRSSIQITHFECLGNSQEGGWESVKKEEQLGQIQKQLNGCVNCAKWRRWGLEQQRMLLEFQKQLIIKEQRLQEVIKGYKQQIADQLHLNQNLQLILQQKANQVAALEKSIEAITQQLEQVDKKQCMRLQTPKKQSAKYELMETVLDANKMEGISLKGVQNTDRLNKPTKDSAFTTRAEGWQCGQTMKKKHIQKAMNFRRPSQLQKFMFQNQTLKDYNAVLLQKLRASKYKRVVC